jgi:hypothetical protein
VPTTFLHLLGLLCALSVGAAPSPGDPKVADAFFQKHEWAKAVDAYKKVAAANPEEGVSWLRLGISYVQLGKGKDAIPPLERAQKLGVQPNLVQYQLAQAVALAGDKGRALQILSSLLDDDYLPVAGPPAQEKAFASLAKDAQFIKLSTALELNRTPCRPSDTASPYREFDFFIGDWDVEDKAGNPVGTSHVERILGGCVLLETWRGSGGGEGRSESSYNPGLRHWQQYWTDGQGLPIFFSGHMEEGELRLQADSATRNGAQVMRRATFSRTPAGGVRQLNEASDDRGRTWHTDFDFTYLKHVAR